MLILRSCCYAKLCHHEKICQQKVAADSKILSQEHKSNLALSLFLLDISVFLAIVIHIFYTYL